MPTALPNSLFNHLLTVEQRSEVVEHFFEALAQMPDSDKPVLPTKYTNAFPFYFQQVWETIFDTSKSISSTALRKIFQDISKQLTALPAATLTLAFEPTLSQTKIYLDLLRAQIEERLLIKIEVNSEIVAGAILEVANRQYTYTVQSRLKADS